MYIAVSCAGVAETRDGGTTWRSANKGIVNDYLPDAEVEWGHDPHFVTLCPAAPQHIWQQNHSGVFYSDDGAQRWRKVSKNEVAVHFGFPIAAHDTDGKTAWVVPLKSDNARVSVDGGMFVGRTTDGGESWQTFRHGLPQEHCYDVVFRHALDQRGGHLCMGTTTGNVYASSDGGESWHCVGHNFPPVHSVRFA